MFDLIGFDADDTLWHNERLYRMGRERFRKLLDKYQLGEIDEAQIDAIEIANIPFYGYGAMGFVLSLIQAGIELSAGRFAADDVEALIKLGKEMLGADVQLFDGAEQTVSRLAHLYPLMLITKGDLNNQLAKVKRSGLGDYFKHIEVVNDKSASIYRSILERVGVSSGRFLMVGNSLRSDILPVIELGGWAVYIPNELTWSHEQTEVPEDCCARLFELSSLVELPELVDRLPDHEIPTGLRSAAG